MRKFYWIFLLFALVSCQKEELRITEAEDRTEQTQTAVDNQLLDLVQKVSSHDGSFDNVVDDSSCFSIDFPYLCYANGRSYTVNSAEDLAPFTVNDELIPDFPVQVTFANYLQLEVPSLEAFEALITKCENGELFNERITCVDFNYPVSVALYDPRDASFETITFTHDRETFLEIEELDTEVLFGINYPIRVELEGGVSVVIDSDDQLKQEILQYLPICQ